MLTLLLVEDDIRLAAALLDALRGEGFECRHVTTGAEALDAATQPADVVLLDLGLPDLDGVEVVRRLRSRYDTSATGIIIVTARGQQAERVKGLRAGADDYVVKPVAIQELVARIEAVARRIGPAPEARLDVGEVSVDLAGRRAWRGGTELNLTPKEFDLLVILAREAGTTVARDRLMLHVWQTLWPATQRSLEVHIAQLRSKLGDASMIQTVRGIGYRMDGGD